jgi:hypothetical protein
MRYVNEDGTVTEVPIPEKYARKFGVSNPKTRVDSQPFRLGTDGKPMDPNKYPICGAPKKMGGICHFAAGAGTNHKGYGRCWKHSGTLQEIGRGQLAWDKLDMVNFPGIVARANTLRVAAEKDGVFDLRDHIFLMESIALTILERAKTMEDLGEALKYIEKCTKVIQRLDEIEHGRKLVIDYQGVSLILAKVQGAVERYVTDSYTKDLIARDIAGIALEGAGGENLSDSQPRALIEGLAVEDRSPAGS